MHERDVQLQHVQADGRGRALPRTLAVAAVVGLLTFVIGLGLGAQTARAPTAPEGSATPGTSVPPPVTEAQVSREFWTAYLNRGGNDWGLCKVAVEITCQPITAVSRPFFTAADPFPDRVTDADWAALAPVNVSPGHYVLAGPASGIAPQAVFEGVGDGAYPTYLGAAQVVWNDVVWVDVGTLGRGRYAAGVWDYETGSPVGQGGAAVQIQGWGLGLIVHDP